MTKESLDPITHKIYLKKFSEVDNNQKNIDLKVLKQNIDQCQSV